MWFVGDDAILSKKNLSLLQGYNNATELTENSNFWMKAFYRVNNKISKIVIIWLSYGQRKYEGER